MTTTDTIDVERVTALKERCPECWPDGLGYSPPMTTWYLCEGSIRPDHAAALIRDRCTEKLLDWAKYPRLARAYDADRDQNGYCVWIKFNTFGSPPVEKGFRGDTLLDALLSAVTAVLDESEANDG